MRIDTIAIENLASLLGQQQLIDLRSATSPLGQAGLIAITGPTGSGKSTILDAVCLALFGQTPRQPRGGDPGALISRTAAHGKVEVELTLDDGATWRVTWSIHRARGKLHGELQPAKREIIDAQTNAVLASGAAEVTKLVQTRLHLTLDQFRSVVLLAQGEFARFLNADDAHRAGLLERLTGTSIYAQLGRAAHIAWSHLDQQCAAVDAALEQVRILDDAALAQLHGEREQVVSRVSEQHLNRAARLRDRDLLAACTRTTAAATVADERMATVHQAVLLAAPERERLRLAEAVLPVLAPQAAVTRTTARLRERGQQFASAQADSAALQTQVAESFYAAGVAIARSVAAATALTVVAHQVTPLAQLPEATLAALVTAVTVARHAAESAASATAHLQRLLAKVSATDAAVAAAHTAVEQLAGMHLAARTAVAEAETVIPTLLGPATVVELRARHELLIQAGALLIEPVADVQAAVVAVTAADNGAAISEEQTARDAHAATLMTAAAVAQQMQVERLLELASLSAHAHLVLPDAPCPLCGSLEHPTPLGHDGTSQALSAAKHELTRLRQLSDHATRTAQTSRRAADQAGSTRDNLRTAALHAQQQAKAHRARWMQLSAPLGLSADPLQIESRAVAELIEASRRRLADLDAAQATLDRRRAALATETARLNAGNVAHVAAARDALQLREHLSDAETASLTTAAARDQATGALSELVAATAHLVGDAGAEASNDSVAWVARLSARCEQARVVLAAAERGARESEELADLWRAANRAGAAFPDAPPDAPADLDAGLLAARALWQQAIVIQHRFAIAEQTERLAATAVHEAQQELSDAEHGLSAALAVGPCTTLEAVAAARLPDDTRVTLRQRMTELDTALATATDVQAHAIVARTAAHELSRASGLDPLDPTLTETLTNALVSADAALAELQQRIGDFSAQLTLDATMRERRRDLLSGQSAIRERRARADRLRQFIGSADGSRFSRFAQALTLNLLLDYANRHLADLAPRYQLQRDRQNDSSEPSLALRVIDRDQADAERPVSTLSGGETFLASLALALALADLHRGQSRSGTLCIDEGFGTLDEQTLALAMTTLERLQLSQGIQILLISHVGALHERIAHRIEVVRRGGGASWLRLVGPDAVLDRQPDLPSTTNPSVARKKRVQKTA